MSNALIRRIVLAAIPVLLLSTASLAITGLTQQPQFAVSTTAEEEAAQPEEATTTTATAPTDAAGAMPAKTLVAQNAPGTQTTEQAVQTTEQAEQAEEPLPELVVDKTPLTQAMAELDRAIAQSKLSVTALDAGTQQRYIQEAINLLAGSGDAAFRRVTEAAAEYRGVRPLLIEARVKREAAEVQWLVAVQRQMEARGRRLAEVAQAGQADGTVPAPPPAVVDLSATVGPTGVLGTRGVRPEEQAADLVARALKQASEALKTASTRRQTSIQDGDADLNHASDQAAQAMEWVVKMLESARKIVQIAIER